MLLPVSKTMRPGDLNQLQFVGPSEHCGLPLEAARELGYRGNLPGWAQDFSGFEFGLPTFGLMA